MQLILFFEQLHSALFFQLLFYIGLFSAFIKPYFDNFVYNNKFVFDKLQSILMLENVFQTLLVGFSRFHLQASDLKAQNSNLELYTKVLNFKS